MKMLGEEVEEDPGAKRKVKIPIVKVYWKMKQK